MEKIRIRDEKKVGSGIRDKHPGSATLIYTARVEVPDPGSSALFLPLDP